MGSNRGQPVEELGRGFFPLGHLREKMARRHRLDDDVFNKLRKSGLGGVYNSKEGGGGGPGQ